MWNRICKHYTDNFNCFRFSFDVFIFRDTIFIGGYNCQFIHGKIFPSLEKESTQRCSILKVWKTKMSIQFLGPCPQNVFHSCCCDENFLSFDTNWSNYTRWPMPICQVFHNNFVIWYYLRSIFIDNEHTTYKNFSKEFIFLMFFF